MKKTVILNSAKFNYDGNLDFSKLEKITEVIDFNSSTFEEMLERSENRDIIVTKEIPVQESLISKLSSSVKLICEAGTGYNNIDINAAKERGIAVCNVPGYSSGAVAQLAISSILNLSSSIPRQQVMIKQNILDNFTKYLQVPHHEVKGKVLGVIGAGLIGREVMKLASAFGMEILYFDLNPAQFDNDTFKSVTFGEILAKSDFISLHCPLTADTKHIIDMDKFKLMKRSAYIINTSRGALIKESDLIEALKNGQIAGAALDVLDTEPPAPDNPLFKMENVILTPHIGWQTLESRQRLIEMLTDNIQAFIGGNPINVVN